MPFTGSSPTKTFTRTDGTRTGTTVWQQAKAALVKILSAAHDTHDQDLADGINGSWQRDGSNQPTADLTMDTFKFTGLAKGTAAGHSVRLEQVLGEVTLTDAATVSIDASAGKVFMLTTSGNRTLAAPTNPAAGQAIVVGHKASGADRTLSLTTGSAGAFRFGTDITALTATTSAKTDYLGFVYNSGDDRWDLIGVMKGF